MADDESSIDIDLLISLVEEKSVLWDKTTELYKNRVATQGAWNEIMTILNPNFEGMEEKKRQAYAKLILQKWTHIRDNYNRSFKKIEDQKKSGNGAKTAKPYIYTKQLSFLQKVILANETVTNLVIENSNKEAENQKNNSQTNEEAEVNSNTREPKDTATKNPIPKKRPMKSEINPVDAKMIKFMDSFSHQEPKVTNRHLSFFNGILPTLDNFDDNEVLEFQMGVLQLLKNIKSSRQNPQFSCFNVNVDGTSRGYCTQEYQDNNNSATTNSSRTNLTTIQASLQSPTSVNSLCSNYSDRVDYNDY